MNQADFYNLTGSFCYDGKKHILAPGVYSLSDGLQAVLEYRQVAENARHLLLRLSNTGGENTKQITLPKTLDLHIPTSEVMTFHTLTGDDCDKKSFMHVDFSLEQPYHSEPADGRSSSSTGFPFFDITANGCTAVMAIGWTGQWTLDILPDNDGVTVQVGLCDSDFYLLPGETVRLPSLLVVTGEGQRQTRQRFRRVLVEHFAPTDRMIAGPALPIAIQCFDRYAQRSKGDTLYESWPTEAGQLRTIESAAKIPAIDTLWLDAAWFEGGFSQGVGNFHFSEGFPHGLKAVANRTHEKGMKFVLWFEPERAMEGSNNFLRTDLYLTWSGRPNARLFRLGDPQALAWLEETLCRIIRENDVDVYRQDFGLHPIHYWRENDAPGRVGMTEIQHVMGMYHLWDTLLAEFPHLLIDDCAGGGRRLDLETVQRSVCLWRSDTGCNPETEEKRVSVWSQNQILGLSEYIPFHSCATWDTDAYAIRSTATQGIACNFDIFNPDFDFEQASAAVSEVREYRDYWNGDFYPLTEPTTDESIWCAYQLSKGDQGIAYIFRRAQSACDTMSVCLEAVVDDRSYALTIIDETFVRTTRICSGRELREGLKVTLPIPRSSALLHYQAV